jgi:hypothetical protein
VGERPVCFRQDDQRKVGNGEHEACIPRCDEILQVPVLGRYPTAGAIVNEDA